MGKRESPKNRRDTGVSVLWAFKLDHLQPATLIFSQNISIFLPFILGAPISYYCRERKEGRGRPQGQNMGKGNHSKMNETQWFLTIDVMIPGISVTGIDSGIGLDFHYFSEIVDSNSDSNSGKNRFLLCTRIDSGY